MLAPSVMTIMHKEMQQRAGKQEQPRQPFQRMRSVFAEQEKSRNRREAY